MVAVPFARRAVSQTGTPSRHGTLPGSVWRISPDAQRTSSAVARAVMPEDPRHAGSVPGAPPQLGASGLGAGNLQVPATGGLGRGAGARLPGDGDRARQPPMPGPAGQRKAWYRESFFLLHRAIQT